MPDLVNSLVDLLENSALRYPDRPAVIDPTGAAITYRQLNEQADSLAGFLVASGVEPGDRVGVILPKGAKAVTAFFAIMKAGAAYVPADFTAPASRNRTILADCEVRAAFLAASCTDILDDWPHERVPRVVVVVGQSLQAADGARSKRCAWEDAVVHDPVRLGGRSRDHLAYILYTSGSTGIPKGVMLSHKNALSFVDWCSEIFLPTEHDQFSSHAPFHFDLSILDLYVPLKHGATVHVISEELGKAPRELAAFIADRRLTVWYSTPSILALLAEFGNLAAQDYSALRLVLFAGEVFPVKHLRRIVERWPAPAYYNLYGPTETNVCTYSQIPTPIPDDRTTPYPIGWTCAHCVPLVLDEEGNEVARGDEGLLYIAGQSVFPGYWNRPEHDAHAFLQRDGQRFYNTGDVVREDPKDGYIYVGRRDRMVKRRGYRIELGEIERALYQHPLIGEVAVLSVRDEAGVRILAYLSTRTEERASIIELKTFCARHLPSYMSPDAFVYLPALPRTSTDKVDYQSLARLAQTGITGPAAVGSQGAVGT